MGAQAAAQAVREGRQEALRPARPVREAAQCMADTRCQLILSRPCSQV